MTLPQLSPANGLASTAVRWADKARGMRRLRIAYVVHDYHRHGGHSRYVAELASRFKHEHEVHVYANTFEEPAPQGLTFHHVPAWRPNALATILTFVLPATLRVRGPFDIIHAQGLCGLRQNVVTAHICQGAWYEAMVRHTGRPSWRKRLFHALADQLERFTFRPRGARCVIAVSERVREDIAHHYGRSQDVRVIYHGVDTETFHPRQRATWRAAIRRDLGLSEDSCVALYVGDLQKALPAALWALPAAPNVHLLVVSRSVAEMYRPVMQACHVEDRVHLVPGTDHVERYYAAADLFLFPTFYDSFGMVVSEAMASGLPVVCSRAAGAAELITDEVEGLLVAQAWQPATLATAINRLAADPALRQRLGTAARRKVEQHTWDEVARQTLAAYRDVVGS
jgi:UDP-glucose:(heptosyl)LPS alpha-1,3-glucosyltransferase